MYQHDVPHGTYAHAHNMSALCAALAAGVSVTVYQEMLDDVRRLIRATPDVDPRSPECAIMEKLYMDVRVRIEQLRVHPATSAKSASRKEPTYFENLEPAIRAMPIRNVELTPKGAPGSKGRTAFLAFETIVEEGAALGHFRFDADAPSFNHPDGPTDEAVR
jgi:hypothetical protein